MGVLDGLSYLKNKASFNRKLSFTVDILFFDWMAIPCTNLISKISWITPNMVTVMSGIIGVVAAYFFLLNELIFGVLFIYISFLLDCVDGNLARKTNRTSQIGAKLDNTADTIKKIACITALTYVSDYPLYFVILLVFVHYALQRIFPLAYRVKTRNLRFTSRGLEPLFSSYDLLVILLLFGPIINFEVTLVFIILIQIVSGIYSRTKKV